MMPQAYVLGQVAEEAPRAEEQEEPLYVNAKQVYDRLFSSNELHLKMITTTGTNINIDFCE